MSLFLALRKLLLVFAGIVSFISHMFEPDEDFEA